MASMDDFYVTVKLNTEWISSSVMKEADVFIDEWNKLPAVVKWFCGRRLRRIMDRLQRKINALRADAYTTEVEQCLRNEKLS